MSESDLQTKTILVVEDEFLLLEEIVEVLKELGFQQLITAMNYPEVHEQLEKNPDLVLLDIQLGRANSGLEIAKELTGKGIPFVFLSSHTEKNILAEAKRYKPQGYLVKPVHPETLNATIEMVLYKAAFESAERKIQVKELMIAVSAALNENESWTQKYLALAKLFQVAIPYDMILFGTSCGQRTAIVQRVGFEEYRVLDSQFITAGTKIPVEKVENALSTINSNVLICENNRQKPSEKEDLINRQIRDFLKTGAYLYLPMVFSNDEKHWMMFLHNKTNVYLPLHIDLLEEIKESLTIHFEKQWAYQKIKDLSELLKNEKEYLEEEIKGNHNFENIIGASETIKKVFDSVKNVAKTDTTVLILGESGTGKELIARSVHNLSRRSHKALIKLNCATLPAQMLESELFGHEKGSFTGADKKRIGKFELANGGTIFLDEIGELPIELQAKLLRVLQEKEFERLGGNEVIKTDIRIIAATNRDLKKEIGVSNFREDLFYRLNVFPIVLPPLRERPEDIEQLAMHFLKKSAKKIGKKFNSISKDSLEALMTHPWPGNIRELEHLIERSIIMNEGPVLNIPLKAERVTVIRKGDVFTPRSLREAETELIIETLKYAKGKIRGKGGAAELLDINPTTLDSRIKKLGIKTKKQFIT